MMYINFIGDIQGCTKEFEYVSVDRANFWKGTFSCITRFLLEQNVSILFNIYRNLYIIYSSQNKNLIIFPIIDCSCWNWVEIRVKCVMRFSNVLHKYHLSLERGSIDTVFLMYEKVFMHSFLFCLYLLVRFCLNLKFVWNVCKFFVICALC